MRLGFVGHRWGRLAGQDIGVLRQTITLALATACHGTKGGDLICGMAEGADLIAAANRPPGFGLVAILPLPVPDWRSRLTLQAGVSHAELQLFDELVSKAKVQILPSSDDLPFVGVAQAILANCDRLVALWDGLPGGPGGTDWTIKAAQGRGVPVSIVKVSAPSQNGACQVMGNS